MGHHKSEQEHTELRQCSPVKRKKKDTLNTKVILGWTNFLCCTSENFHHYLCYLLFRNNFRRGKSVGSNNA